MEFQQAPEENFITYLQLDELDCEKHMLVINDGQQYLSIRQRHTRFQLSCEDNDPFRQSNHFCINMNIMDGVDQKIARFQQLLKLFNKTKEPSHKPLSNQQLKLFKEYLLAVHARQRRATYQEIAVAYFGEKRVNKEWSSPSRILKDHVRNRVRKGLKLIAGEYKNLL